jgi:hypothetical protein
MRAALPLTLPLTLLLLPACALAQDAPRRKSGLWEISMSSPQMPTPMVTRQCVDEKTDNLGERPSRGAEKCSKQSVRREGGSVIVESVCQVEGSTATSRGVFSGDFSSAYKGEMTTTFAPPMHGTAQTKMTFQARLTGPCAPGQKPGMVMAPGAQGMPGGRAGGMDPEQARKMAEEMVKKYQK